MAVTTALLSGIGDAKYKSLKAAFDASNTDSSRNPFGGQIFNIGLYRYHMFTSSDFFQVKRSIAVEVICIGGGGGGGNVHGGGGGGAAIEPSSGYQSFNLSPGNYYATVGTGGIPAIPSVGRSQKGGNSNFQTLTANGGGGGADSGNAAITGGSGGGGTYDNTGIPGNAVNNGAAGTGSNTTSGGNYGGGNNLPAAGGGGASSAGSNSSSGQGGAGGNGKLLTDIDSNFTSVNFSIFTGMTRLSSGGGGGAYNGGTGGNGGAGAGNGTANATPGGDATSFGSGGGGGGFLSGAYDRGGYGKSGLIVIRYLLTAL